MYCFLNCNDFKSKNLSQSNNNLLDGADRGSSDHVTDPRFLQYVKLALVSKLFHYIFWLFMFVVISCED